MLIDCKCPDEKCKIKLRNSSAKPLSSGHPLHVLFLQTQGFPCISSIHISPNSRLFIDYKCEECGKTSTTKVFTLLSRKTNKYSYGKIYCKQCKIDSYSAFKSIENGTNFAINYPIESKEFVKNLDNQLKTPKELSNQSRDLCEWKCSLCGELWNARASSRAYNNRGAGCNKCHKQKIGVHHSTKTLKSKTLKFLYPDLYSQLKGIEGEKDFPLDKLASRANKIGIWKCICGALFKRQVDKVTLRKSILCRPCQSSGKSLFEYEALFLLKAKIPYDVISHYTKSSSTTEVDLYIPILDLAIQLDPYWSHYQRVTQDIKNTATLETHYKEVLRIRQVGLPKVGNVCVIIEKEASSAEPWVEKIIQFLNIQSISLTDDEIKACLTEASTHWLNNAVKPVNSCETEIWYKEFLSNITHPGKDIAYCSTGSEDKCKWKCTFCDTVFITTIATRNNTGKLGCNKCRRDKKNFPIVNEKSS